MNQPKNGDESTCAVCGETIEYYYGWMHEVHEGRGHRAAPVVEEAGEAVEVEATEESRPLHN